MAPRTSGISRRDFLGTLTAVANVGYTAVELAGYGDMTATQLRAGGRAERWLGSGELVRRRFAIESGPMLDLERAESPYAWAVRRGLRWLQDRFADRTRRCSP